MNRNNRFPKVNPSKRGNTQMNVPSITNSRGHNSSSTPFDKPLNSSDHGLDESSNPFSHLALEVAMDRPSANPFDKGIMPSFDDQSIETAYLYENLKTSSGRNDIKGRRKRAREREFVPPPLLRNEPILTERYAEDKKTKEVFRDAIHEPNIHDAQQELDLDDFFLPKPPVIVSSVDLKPQINIRSRQTTAPHINVKPHVHISNREPVESVIAPVLHSKPVVDYFGTQSSSESKRELEINQKEYFKESQREANKLLFGVEEPARPLTNVEVSKRKKLILKLVDQKLKAKLSELMNELGERPIEEMPGSTGECAVDTQEHTDAFDDQMQNLVPDSVPDNVPNLEPTQNWVPYPSQPHEQAWNDYPPDVPNKDHWSIRPPTYQTNPGWIEPSHINPFPPGVDPSHNLNFSGMPAIRPPWHNNPNQWQSNLPPPQQWQPQYKWSPRPMNPHLPNINLAYPPGGQYSKPIINAPQYSEMPVPTITRDVTTESEQELREKEFLKRTMLGSKTKSPRRQRDSKHRRTPEKLKRRSRERSRRSRDRLIRSRSRDRSVRSRSTKRNSQERPRERSNREMERSNHATSRRSVEILLHGVLSPSRLSPMRASPLRGSLRDRSRSYERHQQWLYEELHDSREPFEQSIFESMTHYRSRSREFEFRRSTSRSEDLRVKLSQRRNKNVRSGSSSDLRNKLLSDRSDSNRHSQNDDLRHHLSDRSRKRSTSQSRSRSSKRKVKTEAESEWIRFNNIVDMLMNLSEEKNGELSAEQLSEKKEIMRLLLENPDALELDDKFVLKFGASRLNLAVKEAENILYPNGVPDERTASFISQKISTMSTESATSGSKSKETVPIEWIKLCSIVDQVLGLPVGLRKNLSTNDKRIIERDELLLKISDDPSMLLSLGTKYGHRNVEWAVKFANKVLCRNGVRDRRVDEVITKERDIVLKRAGKIPKSSRSSEKDVDANCAKTNSMEWNQMHQLVTKLIRNHLENFETMSRAHIRRRDELLVQMSRDPDAVRTDTKFTDTIDKAVLNDIIDKCKKIITGVKMNIDKQVIIEFERQRTKLITYLKSRAPATTIQDQIRSKLHEKIAGKWTDEEKKERDCIIEAMIKDPESLRANTKIIERIGDHLSVDEIISDVKRMLSQLDVSNARCPIKFHISSSRIVDIPFVVKIEDESGQLDDNTKTVLLKALRDMISEIENPPKPKLLQQRYIDQRVEVVCANLLTFEWLKRAIVSDFKDKWNGAQLKIERVPVDTKISRDKLKSVVAVFKDARATLPFDDIMDGIKKENSKLYPERWELQDARGKDGDYKKKCIGIDIESLAALEQTNRFARFGRSLVYFDISYMGENVPNFEATCQ